MRFASFNIKSFGSKNCDIGKTIDEVKQTILGTGSKTTLSVEAGKNIKDFLSKISSQRIQVYRLQLLKSDRASPVLPEKINGSENEEPKYYSVL